MLLGNLEEYAMMATRLMVLGARLRMRLVRQALRSWSVACLDRITPTSYQPRIFRPGRSASTLRPGLLKQGIPSDEQVNREESHLNLGRFQEIRTTVCERAPVPAFLTADLPQVQCRYPEAK